VAALLVLLVAPVDADDGQHAFQPVIDGLRLGPGHRLRGLTLVTLVLDREHQPGLDAHVGLGGARVDVLDLPGPAGRWHVRVANRTPRALLLPAGTTFLSPAGPSRSTDRPVWIDAGTAAFVPVVQAPEEPPPGPYLTRGRGLTPLELTGLWTGAWSRRVRRRNTLALVPEHRRDDAGAVYTTTWFDELAGQQRRTLERIADGKTVVGVVAADDRGAVFAHVQTDAARFADAWTRLLDALLVDAALALEDGFTPVTELEARRDARDLLAALEDEPLVRATFGEGDQYRWSLPSRDGRWDGLAVDGRPVSLTLLRDPVRETPDPTPPPPGPAGPSRGGETPTPPGTFEADRRLRPTPFDERFRERRERLDPSRGGVPEPRAPSPSPQDDGRSVPGPVRPPIRPPVR
jgi:hypothetical protein